MTWKILRGGGNIGWDAENVRVERIGLDELKCRRVTVGG